MYPEINIIIQYMNKDRSITISVIVNQRVCSHLPRVALKASIQLNNYIYSQNTGAMFICIHTICIVI